VLYKNLYTNTVVPTREQQESQQVLLRAAEEALRRAERTAKEYPTTGTEEEVRVMMQDAEDEAEETTAIQAAKIKAAGAATASSGQGQAKGQIEGGEAGDPGPPLLQLSQQRHRMVDLRSMGDGEGESEQENDVFLPALEPTPPPASPRDH